MIEKAKPTGRSSVRGAGKNVASEGLVPSKRNATVGREGTSVQGSSDART